MTLQQSSLRRALALVAWAAAIVGSTAGTGSAASFGINFGSSNDGWGPYYVNPANGESAHGVLGYESAFGVVAADWYEPGPVPGTKYLPGAPTSQTFQPASMGSGSVGISFQAFDGGPDEPGTGYNWSAYGFANANQFETVDADMNGEPDLQENGWYVVGEPLPTNGQPVSGEHAVLAGFMFATGEGEYGNPWPAQDITVTITGLSSIASGYTVRLLASAQNGNPHDPITGVGQFTPATVSDDASNTEMVSFDLMPERPNWWSPATAWDADEDPSTNDPYRAVAGEGETSMTFTGDTLTITLSGANEYIDENTLLFARTTLAGIVIEYDSIVPPATAGDFNGDGNVDGADFVIWQTNFPNNTGIATLDMGDANGDGNVDGADFVVWQTNFPTTAGGVTPVPEPGAILLSVLGAVGLAVSRKALGRSA